MGITRLLPWKRNKPADPMQAVQSDPSIKEMDSIANKYRARNANLMTRLENAHARFAQIVAQETPGANATVKRMAAIARDGLDA